MVVKLIHLVFQASSATFAIYKTGTDLSISHRKKKVLPSQFIFLAYMVRREFVRLHPEFVVLVFVAIFSAKTLHQLF
jgi:hypothetical protein